MHSVMAEQTTIQQKKYDAAYYRSIGMPVPGKLHEVDVGEHIIQHYTHSFDEHGNVIVIESDKEDLWLSIPQYQDEVGPKNIIRLIEAGADAKALLNANSESAFYGDVTNFEAKSVNDLGEKIPSFTDAADKALKEFNEKFNTNLDMKTFIQLYENGLLADHIAGKTPVKEGESNGEE